MKHPPPTERELEALKILWNRGEATVREIWQTMDSSDKPSPYTTVLSLMQVMTRKGLVEQRKSGKAHVYRAKLERGKTFRNLVTGFLDRVFDGAVDEYLVHALEAKKLKEKELDQLEEMIAKARKHSGRKPGKEKNQ